MITTSETCYADLGHTHIKVFCDGVEVKNCESICIDEGWATYAVTDQDGNIMIRGDEILIDKIFGVITWEPLT